MLRRLRNAYAYHAKNADESSSRGAADDGPKAAGSSQSYDGRFGGLGQSGLLLGVVGGVIALGATATGVAFFTTRQRNQRHDHALHGLQRHMPE